MLIPHRPDSLRAALLAFIIMPVATITAAAGWIALASLEKRAERRMQEDIELIARAIQLPVGDALARQRPGSLQHTLDSAFQIDRVYGAYVYGADGALVAASGPYNPRVPSRREARRATESGSHGEYAERGGEEMFSFFLPLSDASGQISGLLQVTRHGDDFRNYFDYLRAILLWLIIAAVIILTAVVAFGHHRAVGRSLAVLEASIRRIREGERSHRIPASGPREMRNLAVAMNTMLDAIDSSQQMLEQGRSEQHALEKRLRQAEKMAAIGQLSATPQNRIHSGSPRPGTCGCPST